MIPLAAAASPLIDPELAKRIAAIGAPQTAQVPIPAQATKEPAAQTPIPKAQVPTGNTTAQLQFPAVSQPIPKVQIGPEQQANLARLQHIQSTGPGASQVKNPIGKVAAGIGDALVSGLLPRFAPFIPGTTAHHNMLLGRAETAVKNDQTEAENEDRRRLQQAQAENQEAEAHARLNPQEKEKTGTVHEAADGSMYVIRPDGTAIPVATAEGKQITGATKKEAGTVHEAADGSMYVVHPDGSAIPVTAPGGKPITGATKQESGTVHEAADGSMYVVHPDGTAIPVTPKGGGEPIKGKIQEKSLTSEEKDIAEYISQHPGATRMQAERALALNKHIEPSTQGTWVFAEGEGGKPVLLNTKTAETRPAPAGIQPKGTEAKNAPARDALGYATEYMNSGQFTGPGDEALMDQFFQLAKPKRMNANQNKILMESRDLVEGAQAKVKHLLTPNAPYFSDDQRRRIVDTMQTLARSQGLENKQQTPAGGGQFKEGDVQVKDGVKYKRDAQGVWHKQQ